MHVVYLNCHILENFVGGISGCFPLSFAKEAALSPFSTFQLDVQKIFICAVMMILCIITLPSTRSAEVTSTYGNDLPFEIAQVDILGQRNRDWHKPLVASNGCFIARKVPNSVEGTQARYSKATFGRSIWN